MVLVYRAQMTDPSTQAKSCPNFPLPPPKAPPDAPPLDGRLHHRARVAAERPELEAAALAATAVITAAVTADAVIRIASGAVEEPHAARRRRARGEASEARVGREAHPVAAAAAAAREAQRDCERRLRVAARAAGEDGDGEATGRLGLGCCHLCCCYCWRF